MLRCSYHILIASVALFLTLFCNSYFFHLVMTSPLAPSMMKVFLIGCVLFVLLGLALEILSLRWSVKFVLGVVLLISAAASYSVNTLFIGITPDLLYSIFTANPREVQESVNGSLVWNIGMLFILPMVVILIIKVKVFSFKQAILIKLGVMLAYILGFIMLWFGFVGKEIIFIFKQNRSLYYVINPISPIRSSIQYLNEQNKKDLHYTQVALDAKLRPSKKPKAIVLILGESARGANFSLNGYKRQTNPYLSKQDLLISFQDFSSCGVITAISIPCMLTDYTQKTYTKRFLSDFRDNVLDITQRAGIHTYYIGNNGGGCIGNICVRLPKERVKFYNDGNLDEVMLKDLKEILNKSQGNVFVVLHQMGSHGQNYFERYPPKFRIFSPTCDRAEIQDCSLESLRNTYDNSLLYTDFFIHQSIEILKKFQNRFDVALWYVSDHGESLGENGLYMHGGLPYFLSPQTQTQVPSILWLGKGFTSYIPQVKSRVKDSLSQDYVFHTLLSLWGIETKDYDKKLDLLRP